MKQELRGFVVITFFALLISFSLLKAQYIPKAEVNVYKGVPTLFINGKPNASLCYMTYNFKPDHFKQFGEIRVDLASFSTTSDFSFYFPMPKVWVGPGQYDYSDVDRRFNTIVEANPNVFIFPRIYVCTPAWWDKQHPDEMVVFSDGSSQPKFEPGSYDPEKKSVPSFSSLDWRNAAVENLKRFVSHVRTQPYAKNVIGYQIASGSTEEWLYWNSNIGMISDFSPVQTNAFRQWLKDKYKIDHALQHAWHNPGIVFDKVSIPSEQERQVTDLFIFRDPAKRQKVIDYYTFHSEAIPNMITHLAKAVKEACNYESLVGAFYGYTFHTSSGANFQERGHLALSKLLDSPDIDFLTSPTLYAYREVGTGYSVFMSPQASIQLHGKLWMDENDYRTHLIPWQANYGRVADFHDSESAQLRQLSNEITHAAGAWWFDMGGGWYDSPQMLNLIKKLNSIGERSVSFDRTSVAEIAVVVDEYSNFMMGMDNRLSNPLIFQQLVPLGKIGAPIDYILLDDLALARPYKLYIFLNAFHVSSEQMRMIRQLPGRGAKAILWIYAPGFAGSTLNTQGCNELTGLRISAQEKEGPLKVKITNRGAEMLPGVKSSMMYGTENTIGPLLYGDDSSAEVLGQLYGHDLPGLIYKEINGIHTYYSAAPLLSSAIIRGIAARSGVHIYNFDNDVLYANASFIAVHTDKSGFRTLRFPEKTSLYDVYQGKQIARDVYEVSINLPVRETFLYFLGTKEEWEK